MSKTNCPNCGAAKEVTEIKCPFCGTVYLDMTTIDFYGNTSVLLKFLDWKKQATVIKAIPSMGSISVTPKTRYEQTGREKNVSALNGAGHRHRHKFPWNWRNA